MPKRSCCRRIRACLGCLISLCIAGVIAFVAWHFLGRPDLEDAKDFIGNIDFGDFTDVLKNITDYDWGDIAFNEDPYVGDNSTNAWRTQGEGLTLELRNALDDNWQQEFQIAVADWQQSEVLTLTTQRVAVDHTCQRVDGVMIVCNGNFGDTGWVGINEVEIQYSRPGSPGFIISSVAKMNEFYLNQADFAHRRYTMCHEIGHGFGLPHTDENPRNTDLGDCLDYTNNPENNQLPGAANFERLKSIYIRGEGNAASSLQSQQATTEGSGGSRALRGFPRDTHMEVEEIDPKGSYRRVILRHLHPVITP